MYKFTFADGYSVAAPSFQRLMESLTHEMVWQGQTEATLSKQMLTSGGWRDILIGRINLSGMDYT